MKYSVYPFRLLAHEFDLNNNVSFEYNYDLNDVSGMDDELIIEDMGMGLVSDFLCVVNDLDDGYLVSVESCDEYCDDTVIRFLKAFKEILLGMLDKDVLSEINYTSMEDIKLLDSYNSTEHDLVYCDILDAFNDNLSRCPDSALVSMYDRVYSYGEGAFIADRIAKSLMDLGVESGDCVGFLVPRSELYVFSVLGILSCGGVFVPLDDALPDERLKFMLEDTGDGVVLLNISEIISGDVGCLSSLPVVYGDLACVLYTSGTTGLPKGVKITRKSIINVAEFYVDKYDLHGSDVYGLFSAIGFDVSNFIIGAVLYSGASLSVVPEDIRLNMVELNEYFINQGVTHSFITTQVGKLFMESVEETSLNLLLVAGEKRWFWSD